MTPPTLVPDKTTLRRLLDEGKTHQQIADEYRVSRSSISAAAARYGLAGTMTRHDDTVPWTVKTEHAREYPVRMLRLLGRRRKKMPLNETEVRALDAFLDRLDREDAVVAYDPDSLDGFFYIDAKYGDTKGVPVRAKTIRMAGQ